MKEKNKTYVSIVNTYFVMLETPTQLKEVPITHFNESLLLMQAGRRKEALQ
jgi:hypothetical protein